jgi:hypothetical protein
MVLSDVADEEVRRAIVAPLVRFNESRAGPSGNRPLVIELRDADGAVAGGLWGTTAYGWLFTQLLSVPERSRGQGLGRRLLSLAEAEAMQRRMPRGLVGYLRIPGERVLRADRIFLLRYVARLSERIFALLHVPGAGTV